jgi:excisionase family DNA binding protein
VTTVDPQDEPRAALETDPEVLTVEEAARVLRISRNAAYSLARQWRVTNGRVGLPCIELGRTIRVPRSALDQMLRPSRLLDGSAAVP